MEHGWQAGMCSVADRTRLDSLLGYCRIDQLSVADMFSAADDNFFSRIKSNSHHLLYRRICLTKMKFHTSCAHDPTPWL